MNIITKISLLLTISFTLVAEDRPLPEINQRLTEGIISVVDARQSQSPRPSCATQGARSFSSQSLDQECADIFNNDATFKELETLVRALRQPRVSPPPVLHIITEQGLGMALEYVLQNLEQMNITREELRRLLEQPFEGQYPLHTATQTRHNDIALQLIRAGSPVNAPQEHGRYTPLHNAAVRGATDVATHLLIEKATVNARDHKNRTPLHIAAAQGHAELCQRLCFWHADVNAVDNYMHTPLIYAIRFGHETIIPDLLRFGATLSDTTIELAQQRLAEVRQLGTVDEQRKYLRIIRSLYQALSPNVVETLVRSTPSPSPFPTPRHMTARILETPRTPSPLAPSEYARQSNLQ